MHLPLEPFLCLYVRDVSTNADGTALKKLLHILCVNMSRALHILDSRGSIDIFVYILPIRLLEDKLTTRMFESI